MVAATVVVSVVSKFYSDTQGWIYSYLSCLGAGELLQSRNSCFAILKNSWLLSLFFLKFLSGTGCYINFYAQSFWPHENGIDSYSPTILSTGLECHFSQETHFLPFNSQPKTTLSLITANGKSFSHTLFTERAFFRFPRLLDSLRSSSPLGICPNCISCKSAWRFSTYKGMQHSYVYHSGF